MILYGPYRMYKNLSHKSALKQWQHVSIYETMLQLADVITLPHVVNERKLYHDFMPARVITIIIEYIHTV